MADHPGTFRLLWCKHATLLFHFPYPVKWIPTRCPFERILLARVSEPSGPKSTSTKYPSGQGKIAMSVPEAVRIPTRHRPKVIDGGELAVAFERSLSNSCPTSGFCAVLAARYATICSASSATFTPMVIESNWLKAARKALTAICFSLPTQATSIFAILITFSLRFRDTSYAPCTGQGF